MNITFKQYCKLILHVFVCFCILLSLPSLLFILCYNNVPDFVSVLCCVGSSLITIFFMLKYIFWFVSKYFD